MRFSHNTALYLAAAALASAGPGNAHAGMTFTDRADFEDASSITLEENFNSLGGGTTDPNYGGNFGDSLTLGDLTITAPGSGSVLAFGENSHSGDLIAINVRRANDAPPDVQPIASIDTGGVYTAFGVDLLTTAFNPRPAAYTVELLRNGAVVGTFIDLSTDSFFGVIADNAFDTVQIRGFSLTEGEARESFDNIALGVPAPGSAPLLAAAALALRRRR